MPHSLTKSTSFGQFWWSQSYRETNFWCARINSGHNVVSALSQRQTNLDLLFPKVPKSMEMWNAIHCWTKILYTWKNITLGSRFVPAPLKLCRHSKIIAKENLIYRSFTPKWVVNWWWAIEYLFFHINPIVQVWNSLVPCVCPLLFFLTHYQLSFPSSQPVYYTRDIGV